MTLTAASREDLLALLFHLTDEDTKAQEVQTNAFGPTKEAKCGVLPVKAPRSGSCTAEHGKGREEVRVTRMTSGGQGHRQGEAGAHAGTSLLVSGAAV